VATKIAVIDDSQTALDWVTQKMPAHGFEVVTHDSPIGTQAFIINTQPDLVLLDVRMPGLRGDELCKMLRGNPKTKNIAIALYSVIDEGELKELAAQCEADGYIKKTEDPDLLKQRINQLLQDKQGA
jgi:DNA-binding response OmpR family regulator